MSKEFEDNIKEITEFNNGISDTETATSDMSCYEFCELYQLNGILACIDCGNNPN